MGKHGRGEGSMEQEEKWSLAFHHYPPPPPLPTTSTTVCFFLHGTNTRRRTYKRHCSTSESASVAASFASSLASTVTRVLEEFEVVVLFLETTSEP